METYQTDTVDIETFNQNAKAKVQQIISTSPDMICALEHVGAMYGIAPTHFTVQPGIQTLQVANDHVLTPPDVRPNTKAVVCAIGGVLDHISQRVNDKLDEKHDIETKDGKRHVSPTSDPNKGNVINRFIDANGDEIIVYDSGLMDMANTKEAHMKADEIRQTMQIPMYNPDAMRARQNAYFTNEDQIELSTDANIDDQTMNANEPTPTDVASKIQESAFHLGLISHYRDTDYLGYTLLQEQGFDYVRPTEAFALESDVEQKQSKVNPEDIKHMKFDNTCITKAIQCFNKARAEQQEAGRGEFNLKQFVSSPSYKKGINYLEEQFDCKLAVHFTENPEKKDNNLYTYVFYHHYVDKIYVSKSKGFQLNGLPISIVCVNKAIDEEMTKTADQELFGQFMCASLCHEIFHNIANAIRCTTNNFIYTSTSAMSMALSTQDAATRREIFSRFADTIVLNGDKLNKIEKKKLIKNLCYLSALADNQEDLKHIEDAIETAKSLNESDQEIEALIENYEKALKQYRKKIPDTVKTGEKYLKNPRGYKLLNKIASGLCCTLIGGVIGLPMLKLLPNRSDAALAQAYRDYLSREHKEEYYCDMFAGMYNLPLSFTYGYKHREFTANDISEEKLQYLTDLEKELRQFALSPYPTTSERNYAAFQIAKKILDGEEQISPEVKSYCQWIVNNYSKITKSGVESNYNQSTFDPNEAKDLDEHVQNLILNNNIPVAEFYQINKGR